MAIIGNTIILRAEFFDAKNNTLCDPETIELKVYNSLKQQVGETVYVTPKYKIETGVYEYGYVVPEGGGNLTYEFIGIIEGNPAVARGIITRTWI